MHIYELNGSHLRASLDDIGAKALHLSEIAQIGINVPKGLVLATSAFFAKDHINLRSLLAPHLKTLNSPQLMIRSSATCEDATERSYAGQFASFAVANHLDDVIAGVRACWHSAATARVHAYRDHAEETSTTGHRPDHVAMAVIIQEMIEPQFAGVVFTASPDNPYEGRVEFVEGHAERLMSGAITPNAYSLETPQIHYAFHDQLEQQVRKILFHYQSHQDIEWAFANEQLYIVQTRAVTKGQNPKSWSNVNLNENYPRAISPLLDSLARRSYYHYFKNLCLAFHLAPQLTHEEYFAGSVGSWGGHLYYNMTAIREIIGLTPFAGALEKSFDQFVGYQKRKESSPKRANRRQQMHFIFTCATQAMRLPLRVRKIEKLVDQLTQMNLANANRVYHGFLTIRFEHWRHAAFADFFAMLSHGSLGYLLKLIDKNCQPGLCNSLVSAIPGLVSNQPIYALWQLRQLIKQEAQEEFFKESTAEQLHDALRQDIKLKPIKEAIDSYLEKFGFRCSGELMLTEANFLQRPQSFLAMLQSYLCSDPVNPVEQFSKKHREQKRELKNLCDDYIKIYGPVRGQFTAWVIEALVRFTMYAISCRERVRLKQAHMYSHFKRACLKIGEDLQRKRILTDANDVFHLEYEEISRLICGAEVDHEYIKGLISLRKNRHLQHKTYPENFICDNHSLTNEIQTQNQKQDLRQGAYFGIPACGGSVTARAIVLESLHQIDQLKKGDILVTKQTDPGWICAFPLISGLIVEKGGMLSHGAIVAREFGIPAVVGIEGITTEIKNGATVTIDGYEGSVRC